MKDLPMPKYLAPLDNKDFHQNVLHAHEHHPHDDAPARPFSRPISIQNKNTQRAQSCIYS